MSVDSMQAYRGMDIGTAKPSAATRATIPHRMIDIVDPHEDLTVQYFQRVGRAALTAAMESHGRVVIAGGSGLHFRAIVDPLTFAPTNPDVRAALEEVPSDVLRSRLLDADPDAGEYVDLSNPRRVLRAAEILELTGETPSRRHRSEEAEAVRGYQALIPFAGYCVDAGAHSHGRVERRLDAMFDAGLLDEVTRLAATLGVTASQAVGYKELLPVLAGHTDLETARSEILRATNALVKRQRTFFGRDPRLTPIPWQDAEEDRIAYAVEMIGEGVGWTS